MQNALVWLNFISFEDGLGDQIYNPIVVLISDTQSKETKKKLSFLRDHEDGFELAEYDLKTRGPGQIFGFAQSGVPFFRLANLYDDKELLEITQALVEEIEVDRAIDEQLELFYYKFEGNIGI